MEEAEAIDELEKKESNIFEELKISAKETEAMMKFSRRYHLSITYDFYHNVPRIWLLGHNETGHPLTKECMYEDVISDYADKTVTFENQPHLGI